MIRILITTDGGQSWYPISEFETEQFDDIRPLDCNSLFVTEEEYPSTGYVVGESGLILKFLEHGSWEIIESGTTLPLNKVVFSSQEFGLIAGGYSNDEDFLPIMLISEDGGDHWVKGPDLPYLIHDMQFADSLLGFAVGEDEKGRGVILETTDSFNVAFFTYQVFHGGIFEHDVVQLDFSNLTYSIMRLAIL